MPNIKIQRWQMTMLIVKTVMKLNLECGKLLELPVYDKNTVQNTDKTEVICKLCYAHLKYNEITMDIQ